MEELEIIQRHQIPGIGIFLDTVEYRTAHFHPEWELLWILENSMQVTLNGQSQRLQPGNLFLLPPNLPHEFRTAGSGCTFLCLQTARDALPRLDRIVTGEYLVDEFVDADCLRQELRGAAISCFRQEAFYELEVISRVSRIFRMILTGLPTRSLSADETRNQDRRNARLIRLQQYVDENYMHKLRLADFAAREGCTVSYLSHFVRECLNQTFQEYVNTVRFNSACQRIAEGNTRMLDVCMESGFSDYRYFSRAFREYSGMTPEQFSRTAASGYRDSRMTSRSLHSLERFYTPEESLILLERIENAECQ